MSFTSMHNDYLDPDKHLWPAEEPEIMEVPFKGCYSAQWGLSDFYEEDEMLLRGIWNTEGQNFVADWGCKKEIHHCHVERVNGQTTIIAKAFIDDLEDITDTVLWQAYGGNQKCDGGYDAVCRIHKLDPDEDEFQVLDLMEEVQGWFEDIYSEAHESEASIGPEATWDDLISMIDECESFAAKKAEECYQLMIEIAKHVLPLAWGVNLEEVPDK